MIFLVEVAVAANTSELVLGFFTFLQLLFFQRKLSSSRELQLCPSANCWSQSESVGSKSRFIVCINHPRFKLGGSFWTAWPIGVAHNTQLWHWKIRFEPHADSQVRTQSKTGRKVVATSTWQWRLDTVTTTKRLGGRNFTLFWSSARQSLTGMFTQVAKGDVWL